MHDSRAWFMHNAFGAATLMGGVAFIIKQKKLPDDALMRQNPLEDKPEEERMTIRQSKYLNNLVEQDHRNIKRRTRQMLGFKSFLRAQTLLAGIELVQMIRKGQPQHPAGAHLSPAEQFHLLAA